jgi:hypothetical protein
MLLSTVAARAVRRWLSLTITHCAESAARKRSRSIRPAFLHHNLQSHRHRRLSEQCLSTWWKCSELSHAFDVRVLDPVLHWLRKASSRVRRAEHKAVEQVRDEVLVVEQ